ncbi:MAG: zinc-binding dehydrogenase [Candidatus Sericytochromatia bacterium]
MEKEINLSKFGSYDVLELKERIVREPKNDEVTIKVKACGINFADIMMRVGLYQDAPPLPFSPGYEVSGIVDKVGKNVTHLKSGDRVIAVTYFGGYTSYAYAEGNKTRLMPNNISFEQGAAISINYITSYIALNEMARIRKGDHVLIHGASGGVGLAAIQMAKEKECIIYGTASSKKKLDFIKEMGVHYPISYKEENFVDSIRRLSGKEKPIDVILDPVAGENVSKNLSVLKATGKTIIFGASSMLVDGKRNYLNALKTYLKMRNIDTLNLIKNNIGVFGLNVLEMWNDENIGSYMDSIIKQFESGNYQVNVSETFPLERADDAHKYIQERKNIGKVVLTV